ncbi:Fic family protein [Candidatus Poriferisodalis sp.]|uniref:Fic family protein n=1 Tax=Candidatus Poriferisodalis sp. TaxID=3101277 RepID=UPI003B023C4B
MNRGRRLGDLADTHPWIDFDASVANRLDHRSWMRLGEAYALCNELSGTPLTPAVAEELHQVALVRGAQATVAIEGNTLTEEQVAGIRAGTFTAPRSRAYQEREVRNILAAFDRIDDLVTADGRPPLSVELICEMHRWVLDGVDPEAPYTPGVLRTHSVAVGPYLGPPARTCERLLEQLAEWIDGEAFHPQAAADSDAERVRFALTVLSALLAHLYIAWIHPFDDGNGRTARLLEYLILARSGTVPLAAANLMANHFNLTHDRYYARLAAASQQRDVLGFLAYGIEGLVDGLNEHSASVREQHLRLAWQSFIAETMSQFPTSPAAERQHALVMALPPDEFVPKADVAGLTPQLAQMYARTGPRTLARDLNRLEGAGLIETDRRGVRPRVDRMRAFVSPTSS